MNHDGLNELLKIIKTGDTLVIKEIEKLGRKCKKTKDLISSSIYKDIQIICLEMPYLKEFIF